MNLRCPGPLLEVWRQFEGIPWLPTREGGHGRRRSVGEMVADRRRRGTGGNCFDLAIWLASPLEAAGIPAEVVGHDLQTVHAHVATLARVDGETYLCDLGDQ